MGYDSDLTDKQWESISDYFDFGYRAGRSKHSKRTLVNAAFYVTKTGCRWRLLPSKFPPWKTIYSFFMGAKNNSLSWFNEYRRLSKHVERSTESAKSFIIIAHMIVLLKRIN